MISSSVTGIMSGPEIEYTSITSEIIGNEIPPENYILAVPSTIINTTSAVITGEILGKTFNVDGTLSGQLNYFKLTSGDLIDGNLQRKFTRR